MAYKGRKMKIKTTDNLEAATALTSIEAFAPSNIIATIVLGEYVNDTLCVYRVPSSISPINAKQIALGFGDSKFKVFNQNKLATRVYENGLHYSVCGLLWDEFGSKILYNKKIDTFKRNAVWNFMNEKFIRVFDLLDIEGEKKSVLTSDISNFVNFVHAHNEQKENNKIFEETCIEGQKLFDLMLDKALKAAENK